MDDGIVPRFNIEEVEFTRLSGELDLAEGEVNVTEVVLYRSPDGRRVAATYRESGKFTVEFPCDEFVFVVRGSGTGSVQGGEKLRFGVGDMLYFRRGQVVDFEMSEDFQDVACMISDDQPIAYSTETDAAGTPA